MDKPERIWNVTSGRPIRTETPKAPVVPPKAILGSYARTCFICFSVIVVSLCGAATIIIGTILQ